MSRRQGNQRVRVKIAHPNKWKMRSVKVWEDHHGPVPTGKIIHHDDRNTMNDSIENLLCLTRAEHIEEHRNDLQIARDLG